MKKYVNIIDLREVDSFDMYFVLGAKPLTEDVSVLSVAYRDGAGDIVSLSKEDIDMMNPHSAKEEFDLARLYFSAYCQENGLILVEDNFTIEYCPSCGSEIVVRIPGISQCPLCGCSIVPCSLCEECDHLECPYGCTGRSDDLKLPADREPVNEEDTAYILTLMGYNKGEEL